MKLETYALHKPVKNTISQCKEQCSNEEQDSRAQKALAWMNGTEAEASYLLLFRSPTNSIRNFWFARDVTAAMLVVKTK